MQQNRQQTTLLISLMGIFIVRGGQPATSAHSVKSDEKKVMAASHYFQFQWSELKYLFHCQF